MWEMIGVIAAITFAFLGSLKWALTTYTHYKVTADREAIDIKSLQIRVEVLESDMKSLTHGNILMSDSFHAEINKVLHKMAGDGNE
jgi:hypothetical protein